MSQGGRRDRESFGSTGSGGGGGGGYSPSSERRESYERRDSFRGRARGRRSSEDDPVAKRRRQEITDPETRLSSLIVRIGDKSPTSLEANLDGLATALEADLAHHQDRIISTLMQCVTQLATKTAVYGTLVGLINQMNFDFGELVVRQVHQRLQTAINNAQHTEIKLLMRFICELVNSSVILPASLIDLFETYLRTTDAEGPDANAVADYYVYLVLLSLPWVGLELAEHKRDEVARLFVAVDAYMTRRVRPATSCLHPFGAETGGHGTLEELWTAVCALRTEGWFMECNLKPYNDFSSRLSSSVEHGLPQIVVPPRGPVPRVPVLFRLFEPAKEMKAVEQFLVGDMMWDVMVAFQATHKDCVSRLLSIPVPYTYDHVLVEVILAHMFQLPRTDCRTMFYFALLVELFRASATVHPVLAHAIGIMFERIDSMDIEIFDRFCEWFAFHISNFDWKWNWMNWEAVLTMPDSSAKRMFVRQTFVRMVRLSYWERIAGTLPDAFVPLMPPKPVPHFKFQNCEPSEASCMAATLLEKLSPKRRDAPEDVMAWLDETPLDSETKLDVFTHTLLFSGSKSFSHILNMLERYLQVLKHLGNTNAARQCIMRCVSEFWHLAPQVIVILSEKLLTYRVLDAPSVVMWLFSDDVLVHFTESWIWEVLHNTVAKALSKTENVRKDLVVAEERAAAFEEKGEGTSYAVTCARKVKEELDAVLREQKELFLCIFQRFALVLTAHVHQVGDMPSPDQACWFRCTSSRLRQFGRLYHNEIAPFLPTLESLFFNSEKDARITSVFQEFKNCV